jgi:hypothetical protein
MPVRRLGLAVLMLATTTACGSSTAMRHSAAAMAAGDTCQSHFARQFHLVGGPKTISEGFVGDLGGGRFRVSATVPRAAGLAHPESYTCVVVPGATGLRISSFEVRRTT